MSGYSNKLWSEINATTTGDTVVVGGVTGKKIRVVELTFTCSVAVAVAWQSASDTLISAMSFAANGGMDLKRDSDGSFWCQTAESEELRVNLSTNSNVRGSLIYVLV